MSIDQKLNNIITRYNNINKKLSEENIQDSFDLGYTFVILASDLFVLSSWVKKVKELLDHQC